MRTLGKLFSPNSAPVLEKLSLLSMESIAVVASNVKVLKLKRGTQLPTLKKGMFIVLSGSFEVKTHWKLDEG